MDATEEEKKKLTFMDTNCWRSKRCTPLMLPDRVVERHKVNIVERGCCGRNVGRTRICEG
jgi:hypothetical protein